MFDTGGRVPYDLRSLRRRLCSNVMSELLTILHMRLAKSCLRRERGERGKRGEGGWERASLQNRV